MMTEPAADRPPSHPEQRTLSSRGAKRRGIVPNELVAGLATMIARKIPRRLRLLGMTPTSPQDSALPLATVPWLLPPGDCDWRLLPDDGLTTGSRHVRHSL